MAPEVASVERGAAGAEHLEVFVDDAFQQAGKGDDGFENRPGRELRLGRAVEHGLVRVARHRTPDLGADPSDERVGVELRL